MENTTLKVDGMSCQHCVKAVNEALAPLAQNVVVDLKAKTVSFAIDIEKHSLDEVKAAIDDAGYDVVS
ncbi:copper chaperone CopZ [Campylobacterota bacterium]|nr:copper chaperone CopZ [Campylobacterota bacterium]